MAGRGWHLGTIGGVPIRLDPSVVVIAALVTFYLWSNFARLPLTPTAAGTLAALSAAMFFLSILAHELAHAAMSRIRGIPVAGITLYLFGGATQTRMDSRGPLDEFLITVVGPATSAVLGGTFLALHGYGSNLAGTGLSLVFGYLAYINLALAVFNLLPGFPLDGGRLLRSGLWRATGNLGRATRLAARIGQGIGIAIAVAGLFVTATRGDLLALWPAFVGWFLFQSATATLVEADRRRVLEATTAAEAMSAPPPAIDPDLPLATAVKRYLVGHEGEAFPVVDAGRVLGFVSLRTARGVPRDRTVRDAMADPRAVIEARADEPMQAVAERLAERRVETALVFDDGRLVGVIEPEDLRRLYRRSDLRRAG